MDDFLNRTADASGLRRVRFSQDKQTTDPRNAIVLPLFCETKYIYISSVILYYLIKEQQYSSRYFIVVTYPGYTDLFPFAHEVWEPARSGSATPIMEEVEKFGSNSNHVNSLLRMLNRFVETISPEYLDNYYNEKFNDSFFKDFKILKSCLPEIKSLSYLDNRSQEFFKEKEQSIAFIPSKYGYSWRKGQVNKFNIPSLFYINWADELKENGYKPVIIQLPNCHDLSSEIDHNFIFETSDISRCLTLIRNSKILTDFFNDTRYFAFLSRVPSVCFEERSRFRNSNELELIFYTVPKLLKEYCYHFSYSIEIADKQLWKSLYFNLAIKRIKDIENFLDKETLPSSSLSIEEFSYKDFHNKKNIKLGTKLIKVPLD